MDLIHAAALRPAGWDDVLRRLAAMTGCIAGGLTVERPATRQGAPLTYFGFDPGHVALTFDHYLPMNPLFRIEPRMQPGFVVTNGDVVPLDEFRRSDFYNGWARPQGLCTPVTVVIHRTTATYIPLTLVRADGTGEVTQGGRALLSRLAPHLVHAMDVTVRVQAAQNATHSLAATLHALPCGALLIDQMGRIVHANDAATAHLNRTRDTILTGRAGKLAARDPAADGRLQGLLSAALGLGALATGGTLSLQQPSGEPALSLSILPLPESEGTWSVLGGEFGGEARCLVLINSSSVAGVADQYGLTRAEARVLAAIVVGRGVAAAARELRIARSTVNSHLDKIFQKTGTKRQAELVSLAKASFGS